MSDDQSSKAGSRPHSRVTDSRTVKRGTATHKTSASQRRVSNSTQDTDSSTKQANEPEVNDLENDFELFFTDPQQLLDIFTELEEQNLSLIQNSQDHEEQLEELTRDLQRTMKEKNAETDSLARQVRELEQAIAAEEHKERELGAKVG